MFLTKLGENCFFPKMLAIPECQQFGHMTSVDIYYSKTNKTVYMYHYLSVFY